MIQYLRSVMDKKQIIVYGLGQIGKDIIDLLERNQICIHFICDNDIKLQNTFYKTIKILAEQDIVERKGEKIFFIGCSDGRRISSKLRTEYSFDEIYYEKDLYSKKRLEYPKLYFEQVNNPEVSIVITAYNEWNYTYNCLESILKHKTNIAYEIVLGDDCSWDETAEAENFIDGVKILHHHENMQYLGNCNECVKHAKGKYIYLLGNDTLILEDFWLDTMVECLQEDGYNGAVSGKCIMPANKAYPFYTPGKYDNQGNLYLVKDASRKQEVDFLLVTNAMIKKSVWEQVDGYDTAFLPAYYEDNDLSMKISMAGYKMIYLPQGTEIIHLQGVTYSKRQAADFQKSKETFFDKWERGFDMFPAYSEKIFGRILCER